MGIKKALKKLVVGFELSYEIVGKNRFCSPVCSPVTVVVPPFSVPYRLNFQPIDAHDTRRQGVALRWRFARSAQQRLEGAGPAAPAHTLPPASLPGRFVSPPALLLAVSVLVPAAAHLSRARTAQ